LRQAAFSAIIYRISITIQFRRPAGQRYIDAVLKHQQELFSGLIRIHVLIHASQEPIFGLGMMDELRHHGYRIGPGTLYPLLHGLERRGLLRSAQEICGGRIRRVYRITPTGRRALETSRAKVDELHHELHEEHPCRIAPSAG
jgi:DNA-binding PadR family transcriptional regulator